MVAVDGRARKYSHFAFIFPGFLWPWFDVEHVHTGFDKVGGKKLAERSAITDCF